MARAENQLSVWPRNSHPSHPNFPSRSIQYHYGDRPLSKSTITMAGIGQGNQQPSSDEELNLGRRPDDSRPPSAASKASSCHRQQVAKATTQDHNLRKPANQAMDPCRLQTTHGYKMRSGVGRPTETDSL